MIINDLIYGHIEIYERIKPLIKSKPLIRLKGIRQNGAAFLVNPIFNTTRFEHSVGVMLLIKIFGGSEEEQTAGLLHDISHTAFSHVIDYALQLHKQDYHEQIKAEYWKESGIFDIIKKLGFNPHKLMKEEKFSLLEKPLPDLCADRLDYFLRDSFALGLLSRRDIRNILGSIVNDNGQLKCKSAKSASLIAMKFLELNKKLFYSSELENANVTLGLAIKKALECGKLSQDDLMKDDDYVLARIDKFNLKEKKDSKVNEEKKIRKIRYLDPLIIGENKRISEIDRNIKESIQKQKEASEDY
jgi:hypothetical protein